MTTKDNSTDAIIADFKVRFAAFESEHAFLISQLEKEVAESSKKDPLNDTFWDLVDSLKGNLASDAANDSSDDPNDQEEAISAAEAWVSNNTPSEVALILWMRGIECGTTAIRDEI